MPEVYWTIASACVRLRNRSLALEALQSAVRIGCRDAAWLERDPEFESLRTTGAFQHLVNEIHRWPGIQFEQDEACQMGSG